MFHSKSNTISSKAGPPVVYCPYCSANRPALQPPRTRCALQVDSVCRRWYHAFIPIRGEQRLDLLGPVFYRRRAFDGRLCREHLQGPERAAGADQAPAAVRGMVRRLSGVDAGAGVFPRQPLQRCADPRRRVGGVRAAGAHRGQHAARELWRRRRRRRRSS